MMKKLRIFFFLTCIFLAACSGTDESENGPPTAIPAAVLEVSEAGQVRYAEAEALLAGWMDGLDFDYVFNAEELPVYQGIWDQGIVVFLQQGEAETLDTIILILVDGPDYEPRRQDNLVSGVVQTFVSFEALEWVQELAPPANEEVSRVFQTPYGPANLIYLDDAERDARVYTIEFE